MKVKKVFRMAACAFLVTGILTACGGSGSSSGVSEPDEAKSAENTQSAEVTEEPIILKICMAEPSTDVRAEVFGDFAKEVEEATDGNVKFEIYYSNELGSLADVVEQMTLGANMIAGSSGDFLAEYGAYDIMSIALQYSLPTIESVQKINDSELFESWCNSIEETSGLKVLCCNWAAAPRNVLSTKPINSVADFKGLKIRVPGAAADAFFNRLGSATMTMSFSDIYTSMQQGMVEACEASLSTLYSYSLQETAKYCYLSEHSLATTVYAVSSDVWNTIPAEYQEIIQNAMVKYGDIFSQKGVESQSEYRTKLEEAGVIFVEPSEEDKLLLKQAGEASFDDFPDLTPGLADEIAKIIE